MVIFRVYFLKLVGRSAIFHFYEKSEHGKPVPKTPKNGFFQKKAITYAIVQTCLTFGVTDGVLEQRCAALNSRPLENFMVKK